ncbi:TraB/GumN family protein [Enterococcus faecalis]|uniref:TraB/GumN family protein n=1 Tax=Enterococcus faecalis TaxID=1351 RepID=UPI001D0EDA9C|nr:TraB/GumN family protein [Enterococcus faecalis]
MSFESENKNVEKIVVSNKTYYLVGTSHISENSVKLVKEVIERVQPDTVSIELDKKDMKNTLTLTNGEIQI